MTIRFNDGSTAESVSINGVTFTERANWEEAVLNLAELGFEIITIHDDILVLKKNNV